MRIAGQRAIRPKAYANTPYVLKHNLITENGGIIRIGSSRLRTLEL